MEKNQIETEILINHLHQWGLDNITVFTAVAELLEKLGYTITDRNSEFLKQL
jgi:hypothetical protein